MFVFQMALRDTSASAESPRIKCLSAALIPHFLDQWTSGDEELQAMIACRRNVILQGNPQMPLHEQERLLDLFESQVGNYTKEELRRLLGPHAVEFPQLDA
jgi:hypothetical protein